MLQPYHLDLWLLCEELIGIFLVCIGFLAGSFLPSLAFPEACALKSAPDFVFADDADGGLAAAPELFEDSLSLA